MTYQRNSKMLAVTLISAALMSVGLPSNALPTLPFGHKSWVNSALTDQQQKQLEHASGPMRSGNYKRAMAICQQVLDGCHDVPQCVAVASFTETVGLPMTDARRAAITKAASLAQTNDDMVLVALKARQYQFFEVTRQMIQQLLTSARSVPALYDLAQKCQEAALNDVAHMAMEKAYTGVKPTFQDELPYLDHCKRLGMEDLQRKTIKDLIDCEHDVRSLCEMLLSIKEANYSMRDMNRYGLRKALDDTKTVEEMQAIFETARSLDEPDVANRAAYYVRKGKIIEQIKTDRANYEAQLRAWREGIDIETARAQDPRLNPDAGKPKPPENGGNGTGF